MIDLMSQEGVELVAGSWRYHDVSIVEVDFFEAGPDGQPGMRSARAYDIRPHAGEREFDDSGWSVISPSSLSTRRGSGRVSFNWYRLRFTIPDRVGGVDPSGATVVFHTLLDDYAEIWVDGELPRQFGQEGGSVVRGWNAPNRLVVARDVQPGQVIQLAVFGINGPISASPTNYIFMRSARLEFHAGGWEPRSVSPHEVNVRVERKSAALDAIVPLNPKLFKVAEDFTFTEGPVWVPGDDGGHLLFSDPNENRIYRYVPGGGGSLTVFRESSGYAAPDVGRYRQPGSNGLTLDLEGRLTVAEHGNRRVTRTEPDGSITVLADRYDGKRLNSPNDLIYRSDGTLYFTDPPFGLPEVYDDPDKELSFSGVYLIRDGKTELLTDELIGPNGIAFSPDERWLYIGNWDTDRKIVMRYPVRPDGSLGAGSVLFDMKDAPEAEALDGIEVDESGNLYVSGPGGMWILSAEGEHLGTVIGPRPFHNFEWGDDGRHLYITARSAVYRMPLMKRGAGW